MNAALRLHVVLLAFAGVANALTLSGKVVNPDSTGRGGVAVKLKGTSLSTVTAGDGTWSLLSTTGAQVRSTPMRMTGHLRLEDGRLHVVIGRHDPRGRISSGTVERSEMEHVQAARSLSTTPDTLEFRLSGRLFMLDTVTGSRSGMVRVFDTTWFEYAIFGYLTDERDGRTYRTVKIGAQTWMAENLNFRGTGADTGRAYNNSPDSAKTYGRLYSWPSAMGLPDTCDSIACNTLLKGRTRGMCPLSWHVPSEEEWQSLEMTLGMSAVDAATSGFRGNREGANLKAGHTWRDGMGGDDLRGFRGIAAGCYKSWGFETIHFDGFFWSATEFDSLDALSRVLGFDSPKIYRQSYPKLWGFSLRCVQDD